MSLDEVLEVENETAIREITDQTRQFSSPRVTTHSSRGFRVSGQAQQIFRGFSVVCGEGVGVCTTAGVELEVELIFNFADPARARKLFA